MTEEDTPAPMTQEAPYPFALHDLVQQMKYRPGWHASLEELDRGQGSKGLTLVITSKGYNSYHVDRGETYRVAHYMLVPPAAFDERAWTRWLLEQYILVETHETCEFFAIGDERPFAPNHGPGRDPYTILEKGSELDAATSFRGDVNA